MIDIIVVSQASFTPVNREIYRRLESCGYSIEMIIPASLNFPSGRKNAYPREAGDPLIHFLELKGGNPRVQIYIGIMALLKRKMPKIVFLDFDPVSLLAVKIGRWCKKNNSKLVCMSVENLPLGLISNFKRRGIKGLVSSLVKNAFIFAGKKNISHVFTINNDGLKIFRDLKYKSVSKTPLGFDEKIFNDFPEKREKIRNNLALKNVTIAYFGRSIHEKGVHVLLYALKKIEHLPWDFMIDEFEIYKTEYSRKLYNIIDELNLRDRISFIHANHVEIADYMNAGDIVVLPSISTANWKEQYGRVAPEAMACRNAVVVSDSGALPELVETNAVIFEEGNVDALADLLAEFIQSEALIREYKDKGYVYARKKLGINSQLSIFEDKFNQLINLQ